MTITKEILTVKGKPREVRVSDQPSSTYRWGIIAPGGNYPRTWIACGWLSTRSAALVWARQRFTRDNCALARWEGV